MPVSQISASLLEQLRQRGMEQVFEPALKAGPKAVAQLECDLLDVNWDILDSQLKSITDGTKAVSGELSPPPLTEASTTESELTRQAQQVGMAALSEGRVALCTVAGGQASRLGFEAPKGAFPLGPCSGASLFQMMAGQVARLRELSGADLQWIIQTGPGNHQDTQEFFAKRNCFGLGVDNIHFVCQGTLPALSPDGQFLLSSPGSLFRNPDGHGGFYAALAANGIFELLRARGVDTLFYCQVDNPLVRIGDPAFLGHHLSSNAQMSIKVVAKTEPNEKVGLVALVDGAPQCIEYSDISPELACLEESEGVLKFRAGNIAIHAFEINFAEACATNPLDLHLARKQVQALDGGNEAVLRDGIKFETFVFDALPRANKVVVQMCERDEEFAPVKNRAGNDSIASSRHALNLRARKWLQKCKPGFVFSETGLAEIAPGICFDASDLAQIKPAILECSSNGLHLRQR